MSEGPERDESGQGLTEYAILIATVSLGLILLLGSFRSALGNIFRNSATAVRNNSSVVQAPVTNSGGNTNNSGNNNNNNNNNNDDDDNGGGNNNNGFIIPSFIFD
jgi:Flp pilus assembly pilin Flp